MSFEILGGVLWGLVNDLVDIRHVPGGKAEKEMNQGFRAAELHVNEA